LLVFNRALCDILGYDAEPLTTKAFQELTHTDTSTATPSSSSRRSLV
jgi:hypothetical protein